MSPEQAAGRLDLLGPASDIYSLGATLYCLLTGVPPFTGTDVGVLLAQVQLGEFPPPRQVKSDVPAALEAICCKAMALQPADRYASALALAADVEHWLADEPVSACPEPWQVRAGRWLRRHRMMAASAVAALVVALAGLCVGLVQQHAARLEVEEQKQAAERERDKANWNLYVSHMNMAQRAYEDNDVGRVLELLDDQLSGRPDTTSLRGFEWYYWHHRTHLEVRMVKGDGSLVGHVVISPDGKRLAAVANSVRVWDAWTGQELIDLKWQGVGTLQKTLSRLRIRGRKSRRKTGEGRSGNLNLDNV